MLENLQDAKCVIGLKQVTKLVHRGGAARVFYGADADPNVIAPLKELCEEANVPVLEAESMKALGVACGIEVGAAAAAVRKS